MARSMIALAALVTVMGSGGAAFAASVDPSVTQMTFEAADRDGDGQVSEPELVADMAAAFNSLDANKDRALEESEVPQARPGGFKGADTDGDGKLTFNEAVAVKLKELAAFDANGDGQYSLEEIRRYDESR
jgi:Ca2+-binding EF-hand superfamily protein